MHTVAPQTEHDFRIGRIGNVGLIAPNTERAGIITCFCRQVAGNVHINVGVIGNASFFGLNPVRCLVLSLLGVGQGNVGITGHHTVVNRNPVSFVGVGNVNCAVAVDIPGSAFDTISDSRRRPG